MQEIIFFVYILLFTMSIFESRSQNNVKITKIEVINVIPQNFCSNISLGPQLVFEL